MQIKNMFLKHGKLKITKFIGRLRLQQVKQVKQVSVK